jgi:hypothetical protein
MLVFALLSLSLQFPIENPVYIELRSLHAIFLGSICYFPLYLTFLAQYG